MWATCKQRAELGPGVGGGKRSMPLSLVTGTKLWSAPGGRGQNSVTPGSGHWAEGRGNPKNISKKNGTAHQKKKKIMVVKKKNHGRPMGAAPMK